MDDGSVSLQQVFQVLAAAPTVANVSVAVSGNSVTLVRDGVPEVQDLPDPVPRKMLRRFAYKYGIPMECFYHPEMCVKGTTGKQ